MKSLNLGHPTHTSKEIPNPKHSRTSKSKLKMGVSNWVTGDKFWGRKAELEIFAKLINDGASILLTAPRRMGKTSLMRETERRINDRYYCLQLDLEAKSYSPADFITELCLATKKYDSVWKKVKETFKNILSSVISKIEELGIEDIKIKIRDSASSAWQEKGEQILQQLSELDKPVVIFIDEFTLMINWFLRGHDKNITPERTQLTDTFTSWLRAMAQKYKDKIRIVITGSIGLEPILRPVKLNSRFSTFAPFTLEPWDKITAAECLEALGTEYNVCFEEGAIDKIVGLLGCCIPHHVQMFFENIYSELRINRKKSCSINDIKNIYNTKMLSVRGHVEMRTYEERLETVIPKELLPLTLELLNEAAYSGKLSNDSARIICQRYKLSDKIATTALREIFDILIHDGYLEQKKGHYYFISSYIRDWWKKHIGYGHIPASKKENR